MQFSDEIWSYIESFTTPEPEILSELYRETYLKVLNPRMISGKYQGCFLSLLSQILQPSNILELGTFTGYSAICLAKGLAQNGKLYTIDINDELEDIVNKYIEKSGNSNRIEYINGDAKNIITLLDKTFDLVFIDAEKREYNEYFDLVKDKIRVGGILLADNVLWNGKVVDKSEENDPATKSIKLFNQRLKESDQFEIIILPIRDGLLMARKVK